MATELATNAAFQRAPKSASLSHGGASTTIPQFTNCPNSWCQRVVNMWTRKITTDFPFPSPEVPLIKNKKTKKQRAKISPLYNVPAKLRSHLKYTYLETRVVQNGFRKSCTSFIYSYTELCLRCEKKTKKQNNPDGFLPAKLHHPQSTKEAPSPVPRALTKPSSLGLQFLKAPHLLALAMNSFSRGPSICQNAAVCVTSVKWLMQNLKQNSSKSWTHTTKIKTRRGLFLLTLIESLLSRPFIPNLSPSPRKDIWGQKPQTKQTSDHR